MRNNELVKNVPSSEQIKKWDEKETTQGAQNKADEALRLAKEYAVPKVEGKQLSDENYTKIEKEKLAGLFNYVHPEHHTADEIITDSRNRFVTDKQISDWTDKETTSGSLAKAEFAVQDSKRYTNEQISFLNEKKFDSAEISGNNLILKANGISKEIIILPETNDKTETYVLPKASTDTLGGIKIGEGLLIDENGTVNVSIEQGITSVSWTDVLDKPKLFTPTKHLHKMEDLIGVPTKTSELENDKGFVDINHNHNNLYPLIDNTYSKSEVDELFKKMDPDYIGKDEQKTINSYKINISKNEFTKDKNTNLKRIVVKHGLDTENIILETIDSKTKDSLFVPYRIIHKNSIELYTESPENTKVYILSGEEAANNNEIKTHNFNIKKEAFVLEESGLYSTTLTHNCNSEMLIINILNEDNKESLVKSYKILNNNEIKIYLEKISNVNVTIFTSEDIIESKVINTCTEIISKEQFIYDDTSMLYRTIVLHSLDTSDLIINMIDTETKECITPAYRILDDNSLEIYSNEQLSINLFAISGDINVLAKDYIIY